MTTVVNGAAPSSDAGNGMGMMLGFVLVIVFLFGLLFWFLPALSRSGQAPQINVPKQIDVNINQPQNQTQPETQPQTPGQ